MEQENREVLLLGEDFKMREQKKRALLDFSRRDEDENRWREKRALLWFEVAVGWGRRGGGGAYRLGYLPHLLLLI